ncbi:MAG: hypothetical protein DRJ32_07165 [Thermoprotei archaeon]|nr:MAG: hypothetical protein DRJ32_07165 [Thermoprotei archaeon]
MTAAEEDNSSINEENLARDLGIAVIADNRRVVYISLRLRNMPGVIHKVSSIFTRYNVNILNGFHYASPFNKIGEWSFFADITGVDISNLINELRNMEEVIEVKYVEPRYGRAVFDILHFPLYIHGIRAITFDINMFTTTLEGLKKDLGDAGKVFLFRMGIEGGKLCYESIKRLYGASGIEPFQIALAIIQGFGWGKVIKYKIDRENLEGYLRIGDLFECIPVKGLKKKPNSFYFKGLMQGFLCKAFNTQIHVKETKCVAKNDPYCEFRFKRAYFKP